MKYVILGTAGHIDHGKTSLIRALTGIDTDRLKEEKERGITIELGFAHFNLPNGIKVGIVDVPGHEKFVHHMVSGATGMDMVALLVAADEGVMPQTREHLDICRLLNISRGLVVLTKIDLVDDPDWLELVKEDIREAVKGTFLEGSPIVPVSAKTGEGLQKLVKVISDIAVSVPERPSSGPFRLPVDRVFTMKGFGTVVTGTSNTGRLHVGDPLMVYPSRRLTRARSLQSHGEPVEEVGPGMRTAINLQGLEKSEVRRGDVVAPPDALIPTNLVDVELLLLPSAPRKLKHGDRVRFHTGTVEIIATVALLGTDQVKPGDSAYAQLILEEPTAVLAGDRFIVRSYSPVITIGGGSILNPLPKKHKRKARLRAAAELQSLASSTPSGRILWHIRSSDYKGLTYRELGVRTACFGERLHSLIDRLEKEGAIKIIDREKGLFIASENISSAKNICLEKIREYHARHPLKSGIPRELLYAEVSRALHLSTGVFAFIVDELVNSGDVILENDLVRLRGHSAVLTPEQEKIRAAIETTYLEAGLQPPYFRDIADKIPGTPEEKNAVCEWMINEGVLIRVKDELIFHRLAVENLKNQLISFLKDRGKISTGEFKELAGTSRKYAIPLLEYFDRTKVTLRIGDERQLRKNST
ncbi:selenocysteine-specific translation elongation factor SelB [Thermodesulforhabdus norvegica]|uniref:Selenocysteine-specific elongation factor n=2 Tax=Thermodesulforhabdus norvegica TaxID=39841 RepID=A0A1I4QRR2_9BACT|nr:selenocysteine-specific translation elongation factor SelB [Thermodesulforhabdus norvegica]